MFNVLENISSTEIIVIGLILVLFFGASFVTKLGRVGGQTLKEVKKIKENIEKNINIEDKKDKS